MPGVRAPSVQAFCTGAGEVTLAGLRGVAALQVVLADVKLQHRSVREGESAERAGGGECAGHVVLLIFM